MLLTALVAVAGLWYANLQVRQVRQELTISQEGQITDRYTAAVDNLGDDAIDVRLGGIYALQRLMEDSPRDQPTIVNVLGAYARTHASRPPAAGEDIPADVAAAFSVLVQRDPDHDDGSPVDLHAVHLPAFQLWSEDAVDTAPEPPYMADMILAGTDLQGAQLWRANLEDAFLGDANLRDAELSSATLRRAHLENADLRKASLLSADLSRANLVDADLRETDLMYADLRDAILDFADLREAHLGDADLRHAKLGGADLRDADLRLADLRGAEVSVEQLTSAFLTSQTRLPRHLAEHPAVQDRIAEVERETRSW